MFRMLKGVTEVVTGVTVTLFVSDKSGGSMSVGVTQESSCLVTASMFLMSISPLIGCYLSIWLALGHWASHWRVISRSSHRVSTMVTTTHSCFENNILLRWFYELVHWSERSGSPASDVTVGYVLYQIRLLPFSRVISHNILITIV